MWAPTSNIYLAQTIAEFFDPDLVQRHTLGTSVWGVDPFWGEGHFVYGKAGAAITTVGRLSQQDEASVFTDVPNTANLGRPVYVNLFPMAINELGWFMDKGNMIMSATASVAADASFGITAAGQVGAVTAGKQIVNARQRLPSTTTVIKANCTTQSGSVTLLVPSLDGWFHGVTLSGTGIALGSTIVAMDSSKRSLSMSLAATATGSVSVTGTYTGFIVPNASFPFAQGQIT